MEDKEKQNDPALGFLTTLELDSRSSVGGLLMTDRQGRPLEFQCTTPVEPNRTQVILYGPTLTEFIQCDLIGRTLVDRVTVRPSVLLVDSPHALPLRERVTIPLGWVCSEESAAALQIGRRWLRFHENFASDSRELTTVLRDIPDDADLAEPFERIHAALRETIGSTTARKTGETRGAA